MSEPINCKEIALVEPRSRSEAYTDFIGKMKQSFEAVMSAQNEIDVHAALDTLQSIARNHIQAVNLSEVCGLNADIVGTIERIKMHDVCREALDELMDLLDQRVKEELAKEEKNERVNKLRHFFEQLAKHADALVDLIDD